MWTYANRHSLRVMAVALTALIFVFSGRLSFALRDAGRLQAAQQCHPLRELSKTRSPRSVTFAV
jgi:hypothetical protein